MFLDFAKNEDSKTFHWSCLLKTLGDEDYLGGIPKMRNKTIHFVLVSGGPRFGIFSDFQKVEISKDNIFLKCVHDFSCIL